MLVNPINCSFVRSDIPKSTRVWNYVNIQKGVKIGERCNICDCCYIETGVKIGYNVTIKNGVAIWDGITIRNNVFIGPNVVFTNDKYPKSRHSFKKIETLIKDGASIGANSTILPGITIGKNSVIGAGSVVTKSVPDNETWFGNPARKQEIFPYS